MGAKTDPKSRKIRKKGMQKVRRKIDAEKRPARIDTSVSLSPFLAVWGEGGWLEFRQDFRLVSVVVSHALHPRRGAADQNPSKIYLGAPLGRSQLPTAIFPLRAWEG